MKNDYAFPFKHDVCEPVIGQVENKGMTLLDYFAGQALQGMFSNPNWDNSNEWQSARWAYRVAESMLTVRDEANQ